MTDQLRRPPRSAVGDEGAAGPDGGPPLRGLRGLQAMVRDPLGYLLACTRAYGDIVPFRFPFLGGYLVNHPDHVQRVLQSNHPNYSKDTADYDLLRNVVGNGLLTSEGEFWLRQRRLMQPAFHRRLLASFGGIMTASTLEMLARWEGHARDGTPFDVSREMTRLTLSIVGRALFGLDLSGEAGAVGTSFSTVNRHLSDHFYTPFLPLWFPSPSNLRFHAALRELDEVVNGLIASRRASADRPDDLLTTLLTARDPESGEGMSDAQLRDEVLTLMLAGHETTANALSWTWYLLSNHPEAVEALEGELDRVLAGRVPTVEDLPELPYTERVIQEALRLYPPAWAVSRKSLGEDRFDGFTLPAGATVFICPYTTHRHPAFWERPEAFDPDRFSPEASQGRPPFAYFPFGGGPRLCIGRDFALMETRLVLAAVAQRYRLRLVPGQVVEPEALITLRPRHGVHVTLETR